MRKLLCSVFVVICFVIPRVSFAESGAISGTTMYYQIRGGGIGVVRFPQGVDTLDLVERMVLKMWLQDHSEDIPKEVSFRIGRHLDHKEDTIFTSISFSFKDRGGEKILTGVSSEGELKPPLDQLRDALSDLHPRF